ncbi:MAG: GNAT family N-acetyltransferase [Legionellales bacterium]|nr:GNAT family N-acetyltransferase [Legionellales bacterium]
MTTVAKTHLIIRQATIHDVAAIRELVKHVYPNVSPYSHEALRSHMNHYPQGQFVAEFNGKIVGYCATFKIQGALALQPHTWESITGQGFAAHHDNHGDYLYAMEVCVDQSYRGLRIGNRLYQARQKLCKSENLKGIISGGRIPGFSRQRKKYATADDYVNAVINKEIKDKTLSFQLRNGFECIGVLKNYLPSDKESAGFASHIIWHNQDRVESDLKQSRKVRGRSVDTIRISCVQYKQRAVRSFAEFAQHVEYFVDVVADYYADFVLFPELFTLQLLSIENQKLKPEESIITLTNYTEQFKSMMTQLAVSYNINIIGGSHPTKIGEDIYNISYVFLRDGSIYEQAKIHPTPNERYWWNVKGANQLVAIPTDCGTIGVLICYDSEFPELGRHLINQGARILFIPFCTDERQSYLRVRYCAQARAVENQCYVAMAGNVGNLPGVENMDIQYAQSCILTPCDFPFSRDGIAADTTPNVEMVSFADLSLKSLDIARANGTVLNLKDRRNDLYQVTWKHLAKS